MAKWVQRSGSKLIDEPVCSAPEHLKNQTIRSLNLTDFETWPDDCPGACECICRVDGDQVYTEVRCILKELTNVPKVLPPNVRQIDLRRNAIESFDINDIGQYKDLEKVNLERNKIAQVMVINKFFL